MKENKKRRIHGSGKKRRISHEFQITAKNEKWKWMKIDLFFARASKFLRLPFIYHTTKRKMKEQRKNKNIIQK